MRLEFLTPDDSRWRQFLHRVPHDYYHLPDYVALAAEHEGGTAECLLASAGGEYLFLPYIIQQLDESFGSAGGGLIDVHSPYGYPGPLCSNGAGFVQRAIAAWGERMRMRRAVSGFFRFHPILNQETSAFAGVGDLVYRNPTVSIDLVQPESEIWRQFRRNHRRDIEKARRVKVTTEIVPAAREIDRFVEVYYESMDRLDADAAYYFSPRLFHKLSEALSGELWLCLAHAASGELLSAMLFSECRQLVQCQFIGGRNDLVPARCDKLLYYAVCRWAATRGNCWLHLGGGVGSQQDTVFHLKRGFSSITHQFATWHVIFLPDEYRRLAEATASEATATGSGGDPDFFPAYRRACPQCVERVCE